MKDEIITITEDLIYLNKKNLNGRIYPDNENIREQIEKFNSEIRFGQLEFPDGDIPIQDSISHRINNVRIEGDKVVGEITILDTPHGKTLKEMIDDVVFRITSMGRVDRENGVVKIDKIITFCPIPKENDPYNDDNYEKFHPIVEYNRIFSELDPYGEENWDN